MKNFLDERILILASAFIICLGAVVHATNQFRVARKKKEEFTKADFFILLPISVFSGLIFGLMIYYFTDNHVLIILSSGVGSFLGIAGLNRVAHSFLLFLASKIDVNKKIK